MTTYPLTYALKSALGRPVRYLRREAWMRTEDADTGQSHRGLGGGGRPESDLTRTVNTQEHAAIRRR